MTVYRRIMLDCMADNPDASAEDLRREFTRRVLCDEPLAAVGIVGQYARTLHSRVTGEVATRAKQGEARRKFFNDRLARCQAYKADVVRRLEP
jgi:hypothetical protein